MTSNDSLEGAIKREENDSFRKENQDHNSGSSEIILFKYDDNDKISANHHFYIPDDILEQYFKTKNFRHKIGKEIKNQFTFLYNTHGKNNQPGEAAIIPTKSLIEIKETINSPEKAYVESFEHELTLNLKLINNKYVAEEIPIGFRNKNNVVRIKAELEPYLQVMITSNSLTR